MDLIQLAEIGLLSDCDAVCVSEEHAEKLKWSRAPTTFMDDYGPEHPAVFRAQQAKYPMDLLKNAKRFGGFSQWLSPESRNMTCELLSEFLQEMESQMAVIEQAVEIETEHRYEQGKMTLKDLFRNSELEANSDSERDQVQKARLDLDVFFTATSSRAEQAMDEVF